MRQFLQKPRQIANEKKKQKYLRNNDIFFVIQVFLGRFDNRELQNLLRPSGPAPAIHRPVPENANASSMSKIAANLLAHQMFPRKPSLSSLNTWEEEPAFLPPSTTPDRLTRVDTLESTYNASESAAIFQSLGVHDYSGSVEYQQGMHFLSLFICNDLNVRVHFS
jgi:hypothetical protein